MDPVEVSALPPSPEARHVELPPVPRDSLVRHGLALAATVVTTTFVGGWHWAGFVAGAGGTAGPAASVSDLAFWLDGLRFSAAVLAILGAHEAGHYLACRYYGVDATLPWFLPAPLPLSGTLGAFIRIRGPIPDKRALFDIAVAGPFAGFVVAVPLLAIGLLGSRIVSMAGTEEGLALGRPLIYRALEWLVLGPLAEGQDVFVHPTALAAWFGLLATALNLFPLGQLDGGHVTYAVFGDRSRAITIATAVACIGLAVLSSSWIVWALLVIAMTVATGARHPPTLDDHTPLDSTRRMIAVLAAIVFVLCFTPTPIEPIELIGRP